MAEYTPVYDGGVKPLTKTASAAVTGGQVVEETTAGSCGPAGAASTKVVGVAAFDAGIGVRVTVWPIANAVHEVLASGGAIAVGDGIAAGAAGTITTAVIATAAAAGTLIGTADSAGTAVKVRFTGRY